MNIKTFHLLPALLLEAPFQVGVLTTRAVLSILFCASSLIYSSGVALFHTLFALIILLVRIPFCIHTHKKSIKKLVFTARIKRLFSAALVIEAALITAFCILPMNLAAEICLVISFMLSIITPLFVAILWVITYPIEKGVTNWYISDAKKILRSYRNLKVI